MTTTLAIAPPAPFKGLAPFGESDADALFFFGRERESEVIAANLVASRLTVLYGPSGVGKTSVLRAGAARRLRAHAPDAAVVVHSAWAGDPLSSLLASVAHASPDLAPPPTAAPLADALADWTRRLGSELYLILDQFEELFTYHERGGRLTEELARVVTRRGLPVNVLIAIREEALAELDVFTGHVPNVFGNYVPLDRLDREAGRAAIVGPLRRHAELSREADRVEIEPELVDVVLDQVAAGRVALGEEKAAPAAAAADAIEAPYLQLVMERLWESDLSRGSRVLRRSTLAELGGAEAIVRAHLERAVAALAPEQRDLAARVFNHLVTPSGMKIAHSVGDLAGYAHIPEEELGPVLSRLGEERILRPLDGRYEIFHDVLAEAVAGWRRRFEAGRALERERRRHRRALLVAALALAGMALMTAVAAYALSQRSEAREQARATEAAALAAGAWASLDADPELAMLLAVEAAQRERSPDVEDVLRRSLERSRLLRILPTEGAPAALLDDPLTDVEGGVSVRAAGGLAHVRVPGRAAVSLAHRGRVRSVDLDGRGRLLTAAVDSAYLWDVPSGKLVARLDGHTANVVDARFSPAGTTIATASIDSTARLWDGSTGDRLDVLFGHGNFLTAVAFSPDGETLATAGRDGTARLWEVLSGRPLGVLAGHGDVVSAVAFADGGDVALTAAADGTVRRWNGEPEPTLERSDVAPPAASLTAVSSTGRRAAAEGAVVRLSGGGAPERVLRGHTLDVTSVAFSRDGRFVVTASRDKDARVWDAGSGMHVRLLRRHFGPVAAAAFSPDGRWVVTAGPIKAGLWEAETGRFLFYLRGHATPLASAAFTADGRTIVTADRGGETRAWRCLVCGRLEELVPLARSRLEATGRTLTPAERARYLP